MAETADVVVIGAGVIGCSIAYHLAKAGAGRVVVLDKGGICSGMTYRSGALVRLHYTNPHEARLALKAYDYFHNWDDLVGGDCGFQQTGFLMVVPPPQVDSLEKNVAMLRGLGVNTEIITPAEVREAQPFARADDIGAAAYEPLSGYADPHRTTLSLADAAKRHGAVFDTGRAVTAIRTAHGRVQGVETARGPIDAGAVVCAAGPWAGPLLATAGVAFNLTPTLVDVVYYRRPPETSAGHMVYIDRAAGLYFRAASGRQTFVGANHDSVQTGDPDNVADANAPEHEPLARARVSARIPAYATAAYAHGHQGVYDSSEDGRAVLDQAPGVGGLFIAGGFSGTGFKKSPAVGLVMSELVMGKAPTVPILPFRFTRFAEGDPIRGDHEYDRQH